ncbi:acyltransferase [Raoultella planticola]|uniref:acyltransferase n=1 Tax=Raoultella planticola TaxID=575 RepID=UPI000E86BB2E|nr:acyltransferase [Raoultella planticola]QEU42064.1 acyltransferase [Raoultella planticola]HBP36619.1 galactoside O-acetyltransferase [Raoultella ornithinolytica]
MSYYTNSELEKLGFFELGIDVKISKKTSLYNCQKISIGNHVRIDDFCVLSAGHGGINIGNNIHIAVYSSIIGAGMVTISDYANISSRVAIYSSNDDYSGEFMTNPTINEEFTNVSHADVFIGKHVIIGSGSVILPGVNIEDGVAIGALSLVNNDCKSFFIYVGTPVRPLKERKRNLLLLEEIFKRKTGSCES